MPIPPDLLEILVCPESKAALVELDDALVSTDPATRRRYRVEDGIPRLLIDESEVLDPGAWRELMRRAGRTDLAG